MATCCLTRRNPGTTYAQEIGGGAPVRITHDRVFAPDGEAIAFVSERSGTPEIWIEERPGAEPKRVTDIGGAQASRPMWSSDGARIA